MTTELQTNNQQPAVVQWLANPSTLAQLRTALPSHFSAERMARLALTAFRTNRGLQNCTPSSIMAAVMSAAQLGLEPHVQGQCYLVPHGNECTLIVGYQGLLDLIRRSGQVKSLAARIVWAYWLTSASALFQSSGTAAGRKSITSSFGAMILTGLRLKSGMRISFDEPRIIVSPLF